MGLFISSLSQTQQQAFLDTFVLAAPAILLSGFATTVENMRRAGSSAGEWSDEKALVRRCDVVDRYADMDAPWFPAKVGQGFS